MIGKFYVEVRYDQRKLLIVNRNTANLLSLCVFLHTVEGSEHPLGGAGRGRRVNTKLLIDFLYFLFGVKIFLREEFLVLNDSWELEN